MNKSQVLNLNVIPEGKTPWLSYDHYLELKRLFEMAPPPSSEENTQERSYLALYRFLTDVAELTLPLNEAAIHFNAFALIRRGYQVEPITLDEYHRLRTLMNGLEEPEIDDLDLYDSGGHRALYTYLTIGLGLSVEPGRGPVWHRAVALVQNFEAETHAPTDLGR